MVQVYSKAKEAVTRSVSRGDAALGTGGRGGGLNERALGTGPPTLRVKMAVWEDAGDGGGGGGLAARDASSEGSQPSAERGCGGGRHAGPAIAATVGPEDGAGPSPGTSAAPPSPFFLFCFFNGKWLRWRY